MRKLSSILLPVAAVGALVASTLAVTGPAAADSWGRGYGYGRYERHDDNYRRFDGYRHDSRGDYGRGGWGRSDWGRSDWGRGDRGRGDWGRRDGGDRYGDHRGR